MDELLKIAWAVLSFNSKAIIHVVKRANMMSRVAVIISFEKLAVYLCRIEMAVD